MAKLVTHKFVSTIPDGDDTSVVRPSNWNDTHDVSGVAESGVNTDITSMTGITGGISSPDYIQFDTTYATPLTAGQLGWDGNDTLAVGMAGGNVIQHIGEDQFIYIKADAAITKGQVIMFTGAVGASGVLTGAPATGVTNPQYIMGIAAENLAHNAFGLIQTFGELTGLNTNAFNEGDVLYYDSAVTGGLTSTFPTTGPIVTVASVAKKAGGNGVLVIRVTVTQRITAGTGATITQALTGTTVAVTNPYNPASVAITGGTINNTTIGATTAVAGSFTDLSVTGTTSFDGSQGTTGQVLTSQGVGNTPIWATGGGGISSANIQEFTASGTSTWTKPSGAKLVYIVCQGAGGGGGSGYKQIASPVNAAISGGGGGGTGGWSELMIPAALLGSTETVITGAGGAGGASQTTAGTGISGTTGGDSSFGSWCVARGGVGNIGGTTGPSGGGSTSSNSVNFVSIIVTTTVLSGASTAAVRGQAGTSAIRGGKSGGGGGAGGGIVVATPAALAGGTGGEGGAGVKSTTSTTTGGGGAGGTAGSPNATSGSNSSNYYIGGDGGGGGASQITANGGNGGNGGNSAGGGGGGACQNAFNSGAGGNGGNGSVMVITFF